MKYKQNPHHQQKELIFNFIFYIVIIIKIKDFIYFNKDGKRTYGHT